MTLPARTIRETRELIDATTPTALAQILNVHNSKLPPLTGTRRHVYTTSDCYPAAVGRLQALAAGLLDERQELLDRIAALEADREALLDTVEANAHG